MVLQRSHRAVLSIALFLWAMVFTTEWVAGSGSTDSPIATTAGSGLVASEPAGALIRPIAPTVTTTAAPPLPIEAPAAEAAAIGEFPGGVALGGGVGMSGAGGFGAFPFDLVGAQTGPTQPVPIDLDPPPTPISTVVPTPGVGPESSVESQPGEPSETGATSQPSVIVDGEPPATQPLDPDLIPVEVLGVQVVNPEAAAQVNFALAPANIRSQGADASLGDPLPGCPGLVVGGRPMDVVLVIDNSGSMDRNDANDLRLRASSSFVKLLSDEIAEVGANNRGAVVQFPRDDFSKSDVTLWPEATVNDPAGLTSDLSRLSVVLPNVPPSEGGTDIGAGMRAALDELRIPEVGSGIAPDVCKARVVILLSDGEGTYDHGLTQRAIEGGVDLFVVALGNDNALLQAIAPDPEHYFVIREGEQLQGLSLGLAEIGPVSSVAPESLPYVQLGAPEAFPAAVPTADPVELAREEPEIDELDIEPAALNTADVARPMARWFLNPDQTPVLLEGYKSRFRTFIDLPPGWVSVGSPQLAFDYQASELARDDSSLLISVGGRPALTQTLGANTGVRQTVSAEIADEGAEVTVEAFAPLVVDDQCIDPSHIGRWVELGGDAAMFSPIEMREMTISDFVAGAGLLAQLTERPLTFVVPPDAHAATLESLGSIASTLTRGPERPQIEVIVGELPSLINGPVVSVLAPEETKTQAEIEVLRRSGWPVLTLGGSSEAMTSAARSLNDASLDSLFDVVRARVEPIGEPAPPVPEALFTLESEGYDDRTLRGTGEQTISYSFELPVAWQPSEMRIRVVGSYAASLTSVQTDVTVTVNGQPVGSVELRDETGRLDATIAVPPSSLRRGKNFVRFTAHLGTIPVVCTGTSGTDRWVSIHKTTTVAVEYEQGRSALDLADVPYHLADPSDSAATDIILPLSASALEVQSALEILTAMSNGGQRSAPRITTPNAFNASRHLIVIGAGPNQPLIAELEDVLTIEGGRGLPGSVPDVDGTDAFGAVEIAWSPWGENRILMVASGISPFGARLAATHLTEPLLRSKLEGQVALVGVDRSASVTAEVPEVLGMTVDAPGPDNNDYQAWLRDQIAAPFDPATGTVDTSTRRIIAFAIAAILGGMGLVGFIRKRSVLVADDAADHGSDDDGQDDEDGGADDSDDGDSDSDSSAAETSDDPEADAAEGST